MDSDLNKIIQQSPQDLSDKHIQFFLFQILSGLKVPFPSHDIH